MDKIQITLTVTLQQLVAIATVLNTSSDLHTAPTEPKQSSQDEVPVEQPQELTEPPKTPTAGSKIKMPAFSRSKQQVNDFVQHEQERFDKKSEEDLLKEERAEERAAKKLIKDTAAETKANEQAAEADIVKDIKASVQTTSEPVTVLKPSWKL